MKITVIGTGYVGLVTGACLSDVGIEVSCVDIDQKKIDGLKNGILPIYEPGLKDIVFATLKRADCTLPPTFPKASRAPLRPLSLWVRPQERTALQISIRARRSKIYRPMHGRLPCRHH